MDATIRLLNTMLPMLYALAVVAYAVDFFREDPFAARAARVLMETILVLHALFIGLRTALYEHVPLASTAEVMTTVAFALALVYLFVEWRSKVRKTGMFLISFSFVFQTVSSAFISNRSFPGVLRSPLFALHTVTAVLGYTAFAASAVYGLLFLLLYHELKKSRFGLVYERLPPLEVLARMSLGAVAFGGKLELHDVARLAGGENHEGGECGAQRHRRSPYWTLTLRARLGAEKYKRIRRTPTRRPAGRATRSRP